LRKRKLQIHSDDENEENCGEGEAQEPGLTKQVIIAPKIF